MFILKDKHLTSFLFALIVHVHIEAFETRQRTWVNTKFGAEEKSVPESFFPTVYFIILPNLGGFTSYHLV